VTAADRALVRSEPRLPGLAALFDDAAFTELLATWLPGAGIRCARATYVRYKPGTSCLVSYRVGTAAGKRIVHARAERDDAAGRLRRLAALADRPTPLGPGALVIEQRALAVMPFPSDRRLPALRTLADPVLRRRLFGASGTALEALAYKPERRLVARAGDLVLRAYAPDGWPAAAIAATAIGSTGELRVPETRRIAPAHRVLALGWMPGRPLEDVLGAADGHRAAAVVARALGALHESAPARALPARTGAGEAAALAAAGRTADVGGRTIGRQARALAERLGAAVAARPPGGAVLHGDFSADQVLLDDHGAVLLDLDAAAVGHPVDDLASCLADLELRVAEGTLRRRRADAFGGALVEAYAARADGLPRESELAMLIGAALLRRVAEPFRRRRPEWPAEMEAVVERVAELASAPGRTGRARERRLPLDRLARLEPRDGGRRLPAGPLLLRRAWPAGGGQLLLEYKGSDGAVVAGEWCREGAAPGATAVVHAAPGVAVALRAGDADPRLPGLAGLLRRPDAALASHRLGRRATVRLAGASETVWVKALRPDRALAVAERLEHARRIADGSLTIPAVRRLDASAATVTCATVPGRPLGGALAQVATRDAVRRLGAALRRFHGASVPAGIPTHDAAAEAAVLARWLDDLPTVAPGLVRRATAAANAALPALTGLEPVPAAPLHRDLHDGQVLLAPAGGIGVLDFDTLAAGDPALDMANLLVHFELRAVQRACTASQAQRLSEALIWGYDADAGLLRRIAVYAAATRIRLACVYAYRPQWSHVPVQLMRG
jgi:aminoglycoside phosphotransferase (APT) family kinase protein